MIKVGLTGGIGSGKSFIAHLFSQLDVPVFHADNEAKSLYNQPDIRKKISALFGEDIYFNDQIQSASLAATIFNDPAKLAEVNRIIHPAVQTRFTEWCDTMSDAAYVIHEAAILCETGLITKFDLKILVSAPEELRRQRVMSRPGMTEEEVSKRMSQQWPDERKRKLVDVEINNDQNQLLLPQIIHIHKEIIQQTHG